MSKEKEKSKLAITLPIVFGFLGMAVLINMIKEKSLVAGIESFILSLKTNFLGYILSIIGVVAGVSIGQKIRQKSENK